jgi:hypothetical protein
MTRIVSVDTKDAKCCAKCGVPSSTRTPITRHHKGYDSLMGQYNRGIAKGYMAFRDCVNLCLDCHCTIHYIYEPYLTKWLNHSAAGARLMRTTLIGICDRWLKGAIATPKVPKTYKRQFLASWEVWKLAESERKTFKEWMTDKFEEWVNSDDWITP